MTLQEALAAFSAVVSGVSLTYPTNAIGHVTAMVNDVLVHGYFAPANGTNRIHLAVCLIDHAKESQ